MTPTLYVLFALISITSTLSFTFVASPPHRFYTRKSLSSLYAVIEVKTTLPLGIVLEDAEQERNGRSNGVFVVEADSSSACGSAGVKSGYRVSSVNSVDTRFSDYDTVVGLLTADPDSVEVCFEEKFSDGHPATINVEGHGLVTAAVGDNLREVLLANKVGLYTT